MSKVMGKDVYNAAVKGDLTIFSNKNHEQLQNKTYQSNNNIIHIAAQHKQFDFIKAALNVCESLFCDQNCNGDTPLHIVAQIGDETAIERIYEFFSTQCGDNAGDSDQVFPWRMVNSDGNTPAHVALMYGNGSVARYLVEKDASLARVTNHSKETLLHLAVQYNIYDDPKKEATSSSKENDALPIIELLLKVESTLSCWTNTDGSTPLHRAASLAPPYCIRVIEVMLASCPEAAAVQDESSKHTILHLLTNHQVASVRRGMELLEIPELNALINTKDRQGDTPLHLAARNRDLTMVQVLARSSSKLCLKNKNGVSAGSLVRKLDEVGPTYQLVEHMDHLSERDCEAAKRGDTAFLNEQLVSRGINFLSLLTPTGSNILHIIFQYLKYRDGRSFDQTVDFTKKAIQLLPSLISQQDRNGNTPLHVVAEKPFSRAFRNFEDTFFSTASEIQTWDYYGKDGPDKFSACELKNVKGNTALHVAVRDGNYAFASKLLLVNYDVVRYVNNRNQTPLHLLSLQSDEQLFEIDNLISRMMFLLGNSDIPYMQDEDGLTPLLTAVQERNFLTIEKLHQHYPDCTQIADLKGRTLWHLFGSRRLERDVSSAGESDGGLVGQTGLVDQTEACKFLIDEDVGGHIRKLMASKDNDGNTPLHLAIANQQFDFALFFLDNWTVDRNVKERYKALLSIENNKGVSSYNLIGEAEHLPLEFEKSLFKNGNVLYGHRSSYGVPTTKIEDYANTIGVVAALLATITFTAAFTVPGGLNSSNGTPLLMQEAAFQVFMMADVVAMYTSVMVLFCLLWIMTTGHKKESILLLDVSVFLLQTSFYATLVTFMAGLYITTISIVPAIAISSCVICTLLIILMHKRLVMLTVVPFFGILIIWGPMLIRYASDQLSNLWSRISKPKCLRSAEASESS